MLHITDWLSLVLTIVAWVFIVGGVVLLGAVLHRKANAGAMSHSYTRDKQDLSAGEQGRRAVVGLGATLLGGMALWALDHTRLDPWTGTEVSTTSTPFPRSDTVLNIKDFGSAGDGIADDGPALRRALAVLLSKGGGTLYLPPGIYQCQVQPIPTDPKRSACAWIPSNTRIVGASAGTSVVRLAPDSPNQSIILCNYNQGGKPDTTIYVENLTIDGNSSRQNKHSKVDGHKGLVFTHVTGVTVRDVLFRNVFGLSSGSPGPNGTPAEGFHTDCVGSSEILYDSCRVQSDRTLATASGFSLDGSARAVYRNCTASGLQFGQGFTHWHTKDVVYEACRAYDCLQDGFHSEYADSITYLACTSGKNWLAPYSPGSSAQTTPGNRIGFHIYNGTNIAIVDCIGRGNSFHGVRVELTDGVRISRGTYTGNAQYGIRLEEAQTVEQAILSGPLDLSDNGNAPIWYANNVTRYSSPVQSPPVPATGEIFANPFPFDVTLYISGGQVSRILVEEHDTGITSGMFRLRPAGGSITLYYSAPPSWSWFST